MTITLTIHLWWLAAWVGVGAVLWLPLEYVAHRQICSPRAPFWTRLGKNLCRRPFVPIIAIVAWPLAVREVAR